MRNITHFSSRTIVVSILVVAILLIAATAVNGSLYDIDVDDNSISDWVGVPVFQTDTAGDASPANEDIINAWVASGKYDDDLYFLVEMNGSPAIGAGGFQAIVASIDCNNNGVDREQNDRVSVYRPGPDERYTCEGDGGASQTCYIGDRDGQVVGSYLEWKVPSHQLPPDGLFPGGACKTNIKIRFMVADSSGSTYPAPTFDETTLEGWNIPTDVSLLTLETRNDSKLPMLTVAAAMLLLGVTLIIFRFRRA